MRAGIGLVGLLLGIGLLMWIWSSNAKNTVDKGKAIEQQAKPIAGYGQDDKPATESFQVTGHTSGCRITREVTDVTPGGAMDTFYKLQVGDVITDVGDMELGALAGGDEGLAKTLVVSEGYQKQKPIKVKRGRQTLTLPAAPGVRAENTGTEFFDAPSTPSAPAPAPAPQPAKKSTGLSGQLDAIQDAAGGAGRDQ